MNEKSNSETKNKRLSFSTIVLAVLFVFLAVNISTCSYNAAAEKELQDLIAQEASNVVENIQAEDSMLLDEIAELSGKVEALTAQFDAKSDVLAAMHEYNTNKSDYNNQISKLNTDIADLDSSIQTVQEKIETRKEELRLAAELEKTTMVWIGATGTKYHSEYCRTLRGTKRQITLAQAKAQGRTACAVCGG